MHSKYIFFRLAAGSLLIGAAIALGGPPGGDLAKQQPKWHLDHVPPAPVLTPEEELKTFKLPPGFHMELVAAEPMVEEPITLTFDPDGRIYVVELRAYMPDIPGSNELDPVGRVVRLESSKKDGHYDQQMVFADKLSIPRAVGLAAGGVLVSEPPNVFLYKINPDGSAGERKTIFTDFASHAADPEHMANGLVPCLDNWYYNANWPFRFRFTTKGNVVRDPTISRGQWGIVQDDVGRLFYNSSSALLQCDLFPAGYLTRNPYLRSPVGLGAQIATNKTYPGRVTPGVNRGYTDDDDMNGKLQRVTASCGPTVYRGDQFPAEFKGNAFVCEPAGNLVSRQVISQSGVIITAKSVQTDGVDFLTSQDERFRPVSLTTGPDGSLYVVDMYHGILQHKAYLSAYLADQIKQRNLEDKGEHHGRIWKIVADGAEAVAMPRLSRAPVAELVKTLSHPNGWWRDTAQRLLVERNDPAVVPLLEKRSTTNESGGVSALAKIHALWTLEGMDKLSDEIAAAGARDADPRVRLAALQAANVLIHKHTAPRTEAIMSGLGNDPDPEVQLQLVATGSADLPDVQKVAMAVLARHLSDPLFRSAAISAATGQELELASNLINESSFPGAAKAKTQILNELAECVVRSRSADRINALLALIASEPEAGRAQQEVMLAGVADAVAPDPKSKLRVRRLRMAAEPPALAKLLAKNDKKITELATRIQEGISWPNKPGDTTPPLKLLTAPQQTRYTNGQALFSSICAQCHQPSGLGMEGLAPPLVDSEWVLGSSHRLVRIVLNGVHGPIQIGKKTVDMEMPGLGALEDEQISSVLTYLRREWGHEADPIEPDEVTRIRHEIKARGEVQWTMPELQAVK